jgi:hypothetical protein
MKTMKAFCTAIVLSLTISISAFAGDIATPDAAKTGQTSTATFSTSPSVPPTDTQISDLYVSTISDVLLTLVSMF